ncbi:hypothetical protein BDW66DRAFT_125977 [Aspergillus desertorum]
MIRRMSHFSLQAASGRPSNSPEKTSAAPRQYSAMTPARHDSGRVHCAGKKRQRPSHALRLYCRYPGR